MLLKDDQKFIRTVKILQVTLIKQSNVQVGSQMSLQKPLTGFAPEDNHVSSCVC